MGQSHNPRRPVRISMDGTFRSRVTTVPGVTWLILSSVPITTVSTVASNEAGAPVLDESLTPSRREVHDSIVMTNASSREDGFGELAELLEEGAAPDPAALSGELDVGLSATRGGSQSSRTEPPRTACRLQPSLVLERETFLDFFILPMLYVCCSASCPQPDGFAFEVRGAAVCGSSRMDRKELNMARRKAV